MGIDYVLDLDCAPKRALGTEEIVDLVKKRTRGEMIIAMARERGDESPPNQLSVDVVLQTPRGTQSMKVTAEELLESSAPLEIHRAACASCPADRGAKGFGCYQSIPYPIPTAVEEWLLSRLPDELEGTLGGIMLRNAIEDFGWDGESAAAMRGQNGRFFEAKVPASVQWSKVVLDANQVFHMMFGVGPIQPTHAMMLALFFGVIPHDTSPNDMRDKARAAAILAGATVPTQEDPDMERMARFLRTLPLAARLELAILIDS